MTRVLLLHRDIPCLVDDADYEDLAQFRWHIIGKGYAQRYRPMGERSEAQPQRTEYMHRRIMQPPSGLEVDHSIDEAAAAVQAARGALMTHSVDAAGLGAVAGLPR
jgi:hypothetical protein